MTENAVPPGPDVVVSRTPDGDGAPMALAAARLYAELGNLPTEVVVVDDVVTFRGGALAGAAIRARVAELLREPRFEGWELRPTGPPMT